jgi:hypothetical protein
VRVLRISAVSDPFTSLPAKQIELAEVRDRGGVSPVYGGAEDTKVVQSIISQFQSMGFMPQVREFSFPKISMVLTESEYDMLGIRLDVNEVYDLEIKNGSITLHKSTEGT